MAGIDNQTRALLSAWGCPGDIIAVYADHALADGLWGTWVPAADHSYYMGFVRAALSAINGYPEHTSAILSAVRARLPDALREWSESPEWETIGRATSQSPDIEGPEYAAAVRASLHTLADAIEPD